MLELVTGSDLQSAYFTLMPAVSLQLLHCNMIDSLFLSMAMPHGHVPSIDHTTCFLDMLFFHGSRHLNISHWGFVAGPNSLPNHCAPFLVTD